MNETRSIHDTLWSSDPLNWEIRFQGLAYLQDILKKMVYNMFTLRNFLVWSYLHVMPATDAKPFEITLGSYGTRHPLDHRYTRFNWRNLLTCLWWCRFNPNWTGLFYIFRFGGGMQPPPPIIFVVYGHIATNLVQGLTIKAFAEIWKKLHKTDVIIYSDVVILRNLAKKTRKRVYFEIAAVSSFLFSPTETLQKH